MNNLLIKLPESLPISKDYSLEADMVYGWLPNIQYPLDLHYNNPIVDHLLWNLSKTQILYLGPRVVDCLELHQRYGHNYHCKNLFKIDNNCFKHNSEAILKKQQQLRKSIQRPFLGMSREHHLTFDSDYESGNLDLVIQKSANEYDLYMRTDSNVKGHCHWYNFKIRSNGTQHIKLNICNFSKSKSLYERKLRPYVRINNEKWQQQGENVKFELKQIQYENYQSLRKFNRLSFELVIRNDQTIQIAYCIPYTYTQLLEFIKPYQPTILNKSISGLDVPIITIGENQKKCIIVTARVHPGESNSSYVLEGFINYLNSQEAQYLRKKTCIKIIPMLNPDGVIAGNFRTCLNGFDLNRQYQNPDETECPTIFQLKKLLQTQKNNYMFLDLHGHSLKKNIFIYGPEYPIFSSQYLRCRLLAKIMSNQTEIFRYWSGLWRVSENKRTTARAIINNEFNIVHSFTVECSNGLYYLQSSKETHEFGEQDFRSLGKQLGSAVQDLLRMENQHEKYLKNRIHKRKQPSLLQNFLSEIKKDEENHQIQDEDELIGSQSSDSFQMENKKEPHTKGKLTPKSSVTPKKYQILTSAKRKPRQSLLLQEIECRKSFILESKRKSEEKSLQVQVNTPRPTSAFAEFKRSISSQRYVQSRQLLLRQMIKFRNNSGIQ